MGPDIRAVIDWGQIFLHKQKLVAKVTRNFVFHKKAIMEDVAIVRRDFELGSYFQAGWTSADIVYMAVGPINVAAENLQ